VNLRFVERDGKKILQEAIPVQGIANTYHWHDVPLVPNVEEPKKLTGAIKEATDPRGMGQATHSEYLEIIAKTCIDLVCEEIDRWDFHADYCTRTPGTPPLSLQLKKHLREMLL